MLLMPVEWYVRVQIRLTYVNKCANLCCAVFHCLHNLQAKRAAGALLLFWYLVSEVEVVL